MAVYPEIGRSETDEGEEQKERPLNLIPLVLVFSLGASESICNFIYEDNTESVPEMNRYSWNGGNATLVRILGAIFSGFLMEKYKRIVAIQSSFILLIIGLMILYFVNIESASLFLLGDLTIKFASGMEASSIVYIADYNVPRRRSILLLLIVPVMLFSYYTPIFIRSHFSAITKSEEILFVVGLAVVFLCSSVFCDETPIGRETRFGGVLELSITNITEDKKRSSHDIDLEESSTISSYNSDDDPKADLPAWMDKVYPFSAISFMVLFSVWPKVGLLLLIERYKPELMVERDEPTVDRITSLVMLSFSIIGFLFLNYCKRKTFLIVYAILLIVSAISNAIFEYMFDGVMPEYKLPLYSFVPLVSVWIDLGLATIGSWTMMIVIMGELTPSAKRGLVTGLLWGTMLLQTYIMTVWLTWVQESASLYKFHLLMVLVAVKILMWARSYEIDGREKTQEQVDILWEEVIARRRKRFKRYRKCVMCCLSKEKVASPAKIAKAVESETQLFA